MQRRPTSQINVNAHNQVAFSMHPVSARQGKQPECPAGFMQMPPFLLDPSRLAAIQAFYLKAWQMALAKPRSFHVSAASLPREWHN